MIPRVLTGRAVLPDPLEPALALDLLLSPRCARGEGGGRLGGPGGDGDLGGVGSPET